MGSERSTLSDTHRESRSRKRTCLGNEEYTSCSCGSRPFLLRSGRKRIQREETGSERTVCGAKEQRKLLENVWQGKPEIRRSVSGMRKGRVLLQAHFEWEMQLETGNHDSNLGGERTQMHTRQEIC